ncbi:MAG: DUF262 domain-containing protein [Bacteroidetes bacterium]|nr:DUF262 domain-containing protein [Bacteroidota bacterium]
MGTGLRYEIQKFQRDYTWESEHWDDLWQDIQQPSNQQEHEHYMGYLVLQTIDNKNFSIIDGQQRLTTLSILILAVLKCLSDNIEAGIDKDNDQKRKETLLNSYIGFIDPVTLIANNKLKLNRNSDDYYKSYIVLLRDHPFAIPTHPKTYARVLWFYDRIKSNTLQEKTLRHLLMALSTNCFLLQLKLQISLMLSKHLKP